jgi:hypothetical protein
VCSFLDSDLRSTSHYPASLSHKRARTRVYIFLFPDLRVYTVYTFFCSQTKKLLTAVSGSLPRRLGGMGESSKQIRS